MVSVSRLVSAGIETDVRAVEGAASFDMVVRLDGCCVLPKIFTLYFFILLSYDFHPFSFAQKTVGTAANSGL